MLSITVNSGWITVTKHSEIWLGLEKRSKEVHPWLCCVCWGCSAVCVVGGDAASRLVDCTSAPWRELLSFSHVTVCNTELINPALVQVHDHSTLPANTASYFCLSPPNYPAFTTTQRQESERFIGLHSLPNNNALRTTFVIKTRQTFYCVVRARRPRAG